MEAFTHFIEEKIAPPLARFSNLKYVQIIQRTFIAFTALLIIGSLFILLANLPKELIGDFKMKFIAAAGVGTGYMALFTVVASAFATIEWYNQNKDEHIDYVAPIILAISSWFLIVPAKVVNTVVENSDKPGKFSGVPVEFLGAKGVFTAVILGIVTIEIFRFFINKKLTIKLPDSVPPMVANAFIALIPSFFAIIFWWLIKPVFGIDIPTLITKAFAPLISASDTPATGFITIFLNRLLWTVGIHGSNVVGSVANPVWLQMTAENQAALAAGQALPYTYTTVYYDNYVWLGLAPLAVTMLFTKSKALKAMGALGLVPALFNIGEPLIFGLPIMLNPLMMIPFVLSYIVVFAFSVIAVSLGLVPIPVLSAPWILPSPIKTAFATSGSIPAIVFVLVMWVVIGLIFWPFVKALENQEKEDKQ